MPRLKRNKKLVNSSLQLKLVGIFVIMASVAAMFQVFLMNSSILRMSREMAGLGDEVLSQLPGVLSTNVVVTLAVLVPLMASVGILVTHRIAGPAYNMEAYLWRVAKGDVPETPCKIRKGDELQSLCDALNAAVKQMTSEESASPDVGEADQSPEPDSLAEVVERGREAGRSAVSPENSADSANSTSQVEERVGE